MHTNTLVLSFSPFGPLRPWRRLIAVLRGISAAPAYDRPDAATLHDLGIDPSEWDSVQAEIAGRAAPTRRRVAPWP